MLSDETIEKLISKITDRIEKGNIYVLDEIGKSIKKIGTLSYTEAQQLGQILKFGGSYSKIENYLQKITKLNKKDIEKIFEEVAKRDQQFAKQFYKYRNKDFIPYEKNEPLQRQVKAIARVTTSRYDNISNTLGFTRLVDGKRVFTPLYQTYTKAIDEAVFSVSQGKTTFDDQVLKIVKELASSGIRTVDYASGRSVRLDSAVRMNLQGALRDMRNEMQQQFGEEFGSDGVEISVHAYPAPDHELVQGKRFSNEEFYKFQNDEDATSYDGMKFPATSEETGYDRRSISQYNCQHGIFTIVLGVSKPRYTNEQLQKMIDDNNKGFELNGKHYTLYEGTQLQRKLETEIRKQKDMQIMARASGSEDAILEAQRNITKLTKQYKELSEISGLKTKANKTRVSGYRRVAIKK